MTEFRRELQALLEASPKPLREMDLIEKLKLHSSQKVILRKELSAMMKTGLVSEFGKGRYVIKRPKKTKKERQRVVLEGTIKLHFRGNGWFFPDATVEENQKHEAGSFPKIYIPGKKLGVSLNGDRVRIAIDRMGPPEWKRKSGKLRQEEEEELASGSVIEIVKRRSEEVVGVIARNKEKVFLRLESEFLPPRMELASVPEGAEFGQLAAAKITVWNDRERFPKGEITKVLGWENDPGVDIEAVIREYNLPVTFEPQVIQAAERVAVEISDQEKERREDWTDRYVITIDPATAKDHDDAIWVQKTEKGWDLAVHIADVSHYVKPGTALDLEAQERGNSTYLVDRVLPMIPEILSNGMCSLKPDEERLTKCAVMSFGQDGSVLKSRFVDAYIKSQAKLSYEQAQDVLEGDNSRGEIGEMVKEAWELASTLRKRRFKEGALDMEFSEYQLILSDSGQATGFEHEVYNESHQLIEEFMLITNEAVARLLKSRMKPAIYRTHEDPDPAKLLEFAEVARAWGYEPGDLSHRGNVQSLIDKSRGSVGEHAIKLGLLKSLKRACYSPTPEGHYGLSKGDYCHFTSPIRRYADLVVHRALQSFLDNAPANPDQTTSQRQNEVIAEHISSSERKSAEAESKTKQIKLYDFLERTRDTKQAPVFSAVVTEVKRMGVFVEILELGMKGLVRAEDLGTERWKYHQVAGRFVGANQEAIELGTAFKAVVTRTDRERRRLDFKRLSIA